MWSIHRESVLRRSCHLRTEFLLGLGNERGDFVGVAEQTRSLRRERDATPRPVEETNAEVVFQRFHLKCDGRLREEEMLGGFAEIQMLGDRAKNSQPKIFELGHAMIIYGKGETWGAAIIY